MSTRRRRFTAEQKVLVLREHLKNRTSVSEVCGKYGMHPNVFYRWEKQLFEGALGTFGGEGTWKRSNGRETLVSVGYPQSNGKIERFMRTAKSECIRGKSFLSMEDARKQIEEFIWYYNHKRLHSAIGYITPADMLAGKRDEIVETREDKLTRAPMRRIEFYNNKSTLTHDAVLSNSR